MADTELGVEVIEVLAGSLVRRLGPLHPVFTEKASGVCCNVLCANRVVSGLVVSVVGRFFLKRKNAKPRNNKPTTKTHNNRI